MKAFDVEIKDQPFDPDSNDRSVYYYKRDNGRHMYKVFIYVIGRDVPFINRITYHLHHTFPNPVRNVNRTDGNPNCKLVTWAWGKFNLRAIVEDNKGNTYEITHFLQYDKYFEPRTFKTEGLNLVKTR